MCINGFLYFSPNFPTQMNVSYYNANPTKPNTLGTSWNDQVIVILSWVRFLFLLNKDMTGPNKKVSVPKDFGLCVWVWSKSIE